MAIKYEAYTRLGEKVVGVLHTDDEEAVYDILDQEDLIPYRIRPAQSGFSLARMFPTVFNRRRRTSSTSPGNSRRF